MENIPSFFKIGGAVSEKNDHNRPKYVFQFLNFHVKYSKYLGNIKLTASKQWVTKSLSEQFLQDVNEKKIEHAPLNPEHIPYYLLDYKGMFGVSLMRLMTKTTLKKNKSKHFLAYL